MSSYLAQQFADIRDQIGELKNGRVTYRAATVTDTDTDASTFTADVANTGLVSGLTAPAQFLPAVGDEVTLTLVGGKPIYQPAGIAEGAITSREIALGTIDQARLSFDISDLAGTHVFYGATEPTADAFGDLWLKEVEPGPPPQYETWRWVPADGSDPDRWVQLTDSGASAALEAAVTAQQAAAAKASLFVQATAPTYTGAASTAYWTDTANGNRPMIWDGSAWQPYRLGNGAIEPNSLVASDVIATGTVSAALLEAILVLVTAVIAGDPDGTHVAIQPDGVHVYDSDGNEVIRLGTTDDDYFGIVNSVGQLLASIDSAGQVNAQSLNVAGDARFGGLLLADILAAVPNSGRNVYVANGGVTGFGWTDGSISAVTSEVGLIEKAFNLRADRDYLIGFEVSYRRSVDATAAIFRIRDGGSGTPSIGSPLVMQRQDQSSVATYSGTCMKLSPWKPGYDGQHRFLLTAQGAVSGYIDVLNDIFPTLFCIDLGPDVPWSASVNRGGGATPPPVQNYDTGWLPNSGHWSFRGDGSLRTDTTDVVQGLDPSGFNGLGKGGWQFTIPNISGTVDRVDLYIYSNSTYYNSGAHASLWLTGNADTPTPATTQGPYDPGVLYPKPGPVTITLPASWYANFAGGTSIGIYLSTASSDELYYLRADGPSCQLRLWYHQ